MSDIKEFLSFKSVDFFMDWAVKLGYQYSNVLTVPAQIKVYMVLNHRINS